MGARHLACPASRPFVDTANRIFGSDLLATMVQGPLEKLSDTTHTQPCLLLDGFVVPAHQLLFRNHVQQQLADFERVQVVGNSIGELTGRLG